MGKAFLFLRCQVHEIGGVLVVAVPAGSLCRRGKSGKSGLRWDAPARVPGRVFVECAPGAARQIDDTKYDKEKPYPRTAEFHFRGAAAYGRVPTSQGWALWVQGEVRSLEGLPA